MPGVARLKFLIGKELSILFESIAIIKSIPMSRRDLPLGPHIQDHLYRPLVSNQEIRTTLGAMLGSVTYNN